MLLLLEMEVDEQEDFGTDSVWWVYFYGISNDDYEVRYLFMYIEI